MLARDWCTPPNGQGCPCPGPGRGAAPCVWKDDSRLFSPSKRPVLFGGWLRYPTHVWQRLHTCLAATPAGPPPCVLGAPRPRSAFSGRPRPSEPPPRVCGGALERDFPVMRRGLRKAAARWSFAARWICACGRFLGRGASGRLAPLRAPASLWQSLAAGSPFQRLGRAYSVWRCYPKDEAATAPQGLASFLLPSLSSAMRGMFSGPFIPSKRPFLFHIAAAPTTRRRSSPGGLSPIFCGPHLFLRLCEECLPLPLVPIEETILFWCVAAAPRTRRRRASGAFAYLLRSSLSLTL